MAVDHGRKRIGIAISDETGTIANPLTVVDHVSRLADAAVVARLAVDNRASLIVVGQSYDESGKPSLAGRSAARFADALRSQADLPIVFWDEAFTTRDARSARIEQGVSRRKRAGHLDELAAAVLLQSYLDTRKQTGRVS